MPAVGPGVLFNIATLHGISIDGGRPTGGADPGHDGAPSPLTRKGWKSQAAGAPNNGLGNPSRIVAVNHFWVIVWRIGALGAPGAGVPLPPEAKRRPIWLLDESAPGRRVAARGKGHAVLGGYWVFPAS